MNLDTHICKSQILKQTAASHES